VDLPVQHDDFYRDLAVVVTMADAVETVFFSHARITLETNDVTRNFQTWIGTGINYQPSISQVINSLETLYGIEMRCVCTMRAKKNTILTLASIVFLISACNSMEVNIYTNIENTDLTEKLNAPDESEPKEAENTDKAFKTVAYETVDAERGYRFESMDFIPMTNASNTKPMQEVRVGDSFKGLTLETIYFSEMIFRDGERQWWDAKAIFLGEIIIFGDMKLIRDHETGFNRNFFVLHEESFHVMPWLAGDCRGIVIHIRNFDKLAELLGITEGTIIDTEFGHYYIEGLTIVIDNYTIFRYPTDWGNSADIVAVIDL